MEGTGQLKRALVDATSGAVAGAISRTVTSPLDVIKIRFQVQLEPTTLWTSDRNSVLLSKYSGLFQAAKDIFREEGFRGFWRGNFPALLMVMPYTAIQFVVLHKLKNFVAGSSKADVRIQFHPIISYFSGALAGCAATVGSYPFDLLRTILASQGEPKVYPNMRSAFVDIVRNRGFTGLYSGLSPTLVEIVPYAGLQFGTYDAFKCWTMAWNHNRSNSNTSSSNNSSRNCSSSSSSDSDNISSVQLFVCGLAAGTCAKLACHPLDVVKKRFQIGGLKRHPKYGASVEHEAYTNMLNALNQIMRTEGWAGLYKGILPSTIKAAPAGAVTFVAYELISDWLEPSL